MVPPSVAVCCVKGLRGSQFYVCVCVCVFHCPRGRVLNNRPFLTVWDAVSCQPTHPPIDETEKESGRDGEGEEKRDRESGVEERGLRVFRLIGGQRSASSPARTDS